MDRGRKITGGKYHKQRKKKLYERQSHERSVILGPQKKKQLRVRGGAVKTILLQSNIANVVSGKKVQKAEILNVELTPQNQFLARQNRLLKGAVIETSLGKASITNRPTQEGHVNAILLQQK